MCIRDSYLLFQWSGAVKNGSMAYFCSDVLGADWYMSILSILGAVPMAIAASCWPWCCW